MIDAVARPLASQAAARRADDLRRAEAGSRTGGGIDPSGSETTGRALVPVGPQLRLDGTPARPGFSAAFLAHLVAMHLGFGDRRRRRDPEAVAPRAEVAYGTVVGFGSRIEPGFLLARDL